MESILNETFEANVAALKEAGGQAAEWLLKAAGLDDISVAESRSGPSVFLAGGQSQASRHDPEEEARRWLDGPAEKAALASPAPLWLFGAAPWPMRQILNGPGRRLSVYEPDPALARAVLGHHDFSREIAGKRLRLHCPWDLAENPARPTGPAAELLVHPPARRRAPAQLLNLRKKLLGQGRDLTGSGGRPLDIMVIPPLSGGSLPVAVSLAQAVPAAGHRLHWLDWGPELAALEKSAQGPAADQAAAARRAAQLFAAAAPLAAKLAESARPDLIIALAQAPLEAAALEALNNLAPAALAFWLVEDLRLFAYPARLAPACDFFFHIQAGLAESFLRDWGVSDRGFYLPLAADPELFRPRPPEEIQAEYRAELSFMGAGYGNRRRIMAGLARNFWSRSGRPQNGFKIFGSGWAGAERDLAGRLFDGGRRVEPWECAQIYAGTQVNLNIHSSGQWDRPGFDASGFFVNPRTFEIAAAGGLQIVDARPLLPPLFTADRELAVVERPEDLPDLITHHLAFPGQGREMGAAARARVLAEHTYGHRLARMLDCMGYTR